MRQDLRPFTRLRAIREALGISQADLSRRSGISQPLLSRAERGEIRTWPKFRRDTANALRVPEDLLFGDPPDESDWPQVNPPEPCVR
jgi:transcriptional regulator with XRE-family HTH domain